jgi:NADPH:quinone reductase-like Zn-dependent oxidoreductase/NAD(P)-dependent dehydrogenase (short-subunit alcohol dehydrogenase family)/aryl carrier-like protein
VWGLGRSLINESPYDMVRLFDVESLFPMELVAASLAMELEQTDGEQEIILARDGARFAPRLRVEPRPLPPAVLPLEAPSVRLGFQLPGQLRNLRWEATPRREPAQDEVEIEVCATGLNFRDVMYALGLLSDEAIENGFAGPTLGLEFSGIVRRVGDRKCGYAPGDQVVGFGPSSFGNQVITKIGAISQIPPGISFEAAATIPSTFFTAYYSLHHLARLQPGEKILIHGAAGGVGIAAIQLAKWIGAEIYATAGSDEKRDFLRLLGIDRIFDSRSLAFADEILAVTEGKGVDVVLNSLAGEAINRNFRALRPFGRFLELGKRDFYENTKIGLRPFRNNISYFGIDADQLMQAHPDLTRKLFAELMGLFTDGVLHPLPYHVFDAEDIVDAFRYMQQARQIGKIVVSYRNGISHVHNPKPVAQTRLTLPADATYLVTGGLRGFGLATAEWLVGRGARNLILLGRSGPSSEEALVTIARLERLGAKVLCRACDITDRQSLERVLDEASVVMPPLRGIVHAAAIIHDGMIRNLDLQQMRSVLAPKVLGALNLHQLSLRYRIDLFVLFSSATTLLGNPGQGNYVAANAALEALAKRRRARGLVATCVSWGVIDDVGYLARNEKIKSALQSRMGGSALSSTVALDALESMLLGNSSGMGVMELDWKALSRFLPSANSPKFSELSRTADDTDQDEDHIEDIHRLLAELSDADLQSTFAEMLKTEVSEILRVPTDRIDPERSIYDMGLDSLMGVELAVAIEARFGIRLPVMALSQSPTIARLAERIIQQLKQGDSTETAAGQKTLIAQAEQVASQHGVEVSPESIVGLTEDIQSQSGGLNLRMIR